MARRLTIGEARWPSTPDFLTVATDWRRNASDIMLEFVWQGYDQFFVDVLLHIDISLADEQLERSITQYFTPKIRDCMTGYEPFHVEQGVYENETRLASPAQPPLYDLAFVLKSNPRIMWPLEAKVLKNEGDVGRYVKEITDNFLPCRYAPFSCEGAMIGYLLDGSPSKAFVAISAKVPCTMNSSTNFASRAHNVSDHKRTIPAGKQYPVDFRCNHLIFELAAALPCPSLVI